MTYIARILYENHRTESNGFALHTLVCAMVDHRRGLHGARSAEARIDGIPLNGNSKVLRACREQLEQRFGGLARGARFAMIDGDRLPEVGTLGLAATATLAERRAALAKHYPEVEFVVVDAARAGDSNTEALVAQTAACLGLAATDGIVAGAMRKSKGSLNDRDRLFQRAAAMHPPIFDCILAAQPSLAAMVDTLAKLAEAAAT